MTHYVVILDWAGNDAEGVNILGVTHTLEEAKVIFAENITKEKEIAEQAGFEVETDTDVEFEAYESGYYAVAHTRLYIQGVE